MQQQKDSDAGAERPFDEPLFVSCIIAFGMAAGLLVPGLADMLEPAILPSLFVIVVASLVPFRSIVSTALMKLQGRVTVVVLWLQVALPIFVFSLARVIDVPDAILPFVLLSACSGAVFASPALADLFGLDRNQAALIMILSTMLMPVSLCVFVGPLIGLDSLYAFEVFGLRVIIFLVLPLLLVLVIRVVENALRGRRKPVPAGDGGDEGGVEVQTPAETFAALLDRLSTRVGMLALAVFAAGIMKGVAVGIATDPGMMLALFAGALVVNVGMMITTRLALNPLGADIAHTASIIAMTRNVGLAYAMTSLFFGPTLLQYVALCQVPLLIGPVILRLRWATKTNAVQRA